MHRGLPMLPCRCSKLDHCLYDLLIRVENGELACSIPIIISNHPGG
jgi:formyltetrahydrofolate deformylase